MLNLRSGSLTSRRLARVAFVVILAGLAGVTGSAYLQAEPDEAYDSVSLQPTQAYFAQLPFEHVDMINGNLLLTFTDLALPGDAGLDLRLERSYSHQASGAERWRFGLAGVPIRIGTWNGPSGSDSYPTLLMADGGERMTVPANGLPVDSVFVAEDFSRYTVLTKTLELPNGWVATYGTTDRLVEIRDPFDNTITPTWDPSAYPDRMTAIVQTVSGATRRVEFTYTTESAHMPKQMRLIDGGSNGGDRVWDYGYGVTVQEFQPVYMLTQVSLAGTPWTWSFSNTFGGVGATDTVEVTTPNGGTVTYVFNDRLTPRPNDPDRHRSEIATRAISEGGVPGGTWNFTLVHPSTGRVTLPDNRILTFVHESDTADNDFGPRRWVLKSKTLEGGGQTSSMTRQFEQLWVTPSDRLKVVTEETILQDGRSYVTDYSYGAADYSDYHRPNKIEAWSGPRVRRIDRTYQHLSSPYLKGLMTSETVTVDDESSASSFTYDSTTGFMTAQTVAGVTTTFSPSDQGNRESSTDANDKTTSVSYQWGVVKETTTEEYVIQRAVRLDGAVISETRNSATTTYKYDDLGRPTEVAPPGGLDPTVTEYFVDKVVTTRDGVSVTTNIGHRGGGTRGVGRSSRHTIYRRVP